MRLNHLAWAMRLFLAYLFLTASIGGWAWNEGRWVQVEGKLVDPQRFLFHLRALDLLEDPWNAWVAMSLPWLEAVTGIALILPWTTLGGSAMAAGLLGTFVVSLTTAQQRGLEIDCGCFGGTAATDNLNVAIAWRVLWLGLAVFSFVIAWQTTQGRAAKSQ